MANVYTNDIVNGISFKEYAMNCARAFGACFELRDLPLGEDKIPLLFEPSDYHLKVKQKTMEEIEKLFTMTIDDCERMAETEWEYAEIRRIKRIADRKKIRKSYDDMLTLVNAWVPPTEEHIALHNFMKTQIEESIRFDCLWDDGIEEITPKLTGHEWRSRKMDELKKSLNYHSDHYDKNCKRAAEKTAWIQALRNSLQK